MIPYVSKDEMANIDSVAVNRFGVKTEMLMENAGHAVADVAREMTRKLKGKKIIVLAGRGNNGGDGLVAARFLSNWGADVTVIASGHPDNTGSLTKWHLEILRTMHIDRLFSTDSLKFEFALNRSDLIIDAFLGYNIRGNPEGMLADVITLANNSKRKILSADIPSGLNPDSGEPYEPCRKADATVTFALPKKGLKNKKYAGKVYVADIGIPHEVYEHLGMNVGRIFEKKSIIKL